MKLLYTAIKYDYNDKSRGLDLNYNHMYKSFLKIPGLEVIYFDCCDFKSPQLRKENNKKIIEIIDKEKPHIMFYIAYVDQLLPETLKYIKNNTKTTTINWFCDDTWRFDSFTKEWCWYFDYSITMGADNISKYHKIGYKNVIASQWAVNPDYCPKLDLPYRFDVSFVGQPHGKRKEIIHKIKKAGIDIAYFGYGWKKNSFNKFWNKIFDHYPNLKHGLGKISDEEMIKVFCQSKINLNLSNASVPSTPDQIKARNFEVPACGGFLLTGRVKGLEDYYEIGKEIVCYDDLDDMIDKIKYYLIHDDERVKIAEAGYKRTLRDHTYKNRFEKILQQIKLKD